ncbi:MAG TPA: hypothetical protein VN520_16780 [Streptomyces sp.]|uniref:hypothetical protein n=1 Tax=Streptomyces sp. TaxID=1931 RepID=UPI002D061B57|nr:hypothetical protein [Streptomyces sp.]HWU08011.1 hypothetical protein [Streptomyces sp.]
MSEPTRYSTGIVELPYAIDRSEPEPVAGCACCVELANVRDRARTGGDMTTVSDCNVFLRRHPEGHQ